MAKVEFTVDRHSQFLVISTVIDEAVVNGDVTQNGIIVSFTLSVVRTNENASGESLVSGIRTGLLIMEATGIRRTPG
jgi:hypothetical protein